MVSKVHKRGRRLVSSSPLPHVRPFREAPHAQKGHAPYIPTTRHYTYAVSGQFCAGAYTDRERPQKLAARNAIRGHPAFGHFLASLFQRAISYSGIGFS